MAWSLQFIRPGSPYFCHRLTYWVLALQQFGDIVHVDYRSHLWQGLRRLHQHFGICVWACQRWKLTSRGWLKWTHCQWNFRRPAESHRLDQWPSLGRIALVQDCGSQRSLGRIIKSWWQRSVWISRVRSFYFRNQTSVWDNWVPRVACQSDRS